MTLLSFQGQIGIEMDNFWGESLHEFSLSWVLVCLQFAVLMWVFTYVGALFNGLTLLILALISLFSIPVIYERHQAQIDHYLGLANKSVKEAMAK
ncbi:hypothetical protein U0070_016655 [Myodes glareolus]|uniref:Reticulon n=1 Tax=Myodes glareolus TaxID=447135 RepID=A0AAW0HZC7_MYOGA